jgi:hypothetical protein
MRKGRALDAPCLGPPRASAKRRRVLVVVCLALSCAGVRHPPAKPEPPRVVKTYAPLAFKADAKAASQAVILGTDDRDGATLLPLAGAPGSSVVDAPSQLGTATISIATAPSRDGAVHVSPLDPSATWRAGAWLAALAVGAVLDKDLTDFTFSATSSGHLDGVAASGLMAAGAIAALAGTTIDPRATLVGAVNPDGTLGPVAGLPEQVVAALDDGKQRIGVPLGMRFARSANTGESVDVVELAKHRGARVVELADVRDAYQVLTGKQLPRPVPVDPADLALDDATRAVLAAKLAQWQRRLATQWARILQLESAGRLPLLLVYLRDTAKRTAEAAEQLRKQDRVAAAYARMVAAEAYATSANQLYDVLVSVQANKLDAALAALDQLAAAEPAARDALTKVGALQPTTIAGQLQLLAAARAALRGCVFADFATRALVTAKAHVNSLAGTDAATLGSDPIADAVVAKTAPAILYFAKTRVETALAADQLELAGGADVAHTPAAEALLALATAFRAAAAAALTDVDTQLVARYAERAHVGADEARTRIALLEPSYVVAAALAKPETGDSLPAQLVASWGDGSTAAALLALAAGQLAYTHAAELIAKYASLEVPLDDARDGTQLPYDQALAALLVSADRSARASARAARIATGAIPVQAELAYELASVQRDGTLADRLDALAQYWVASAYAQTAVMLARN